MIKHIDTAALHAQILTQNSALNYAGLIYWYPNCIDVLTNYNELNNVTFYLTTYYYKPAMNNKHYTRPSKDNPNLLIPTRERALVDYMLYQDEYGDEGLLIEALQNYLEQFKDMDKLYEVADFYKLPRETVDYWIKEAEEETSMSMG